MTEAPVQQGEWEELLRDGEIDIEGRMPWSSNATFLASVTSSVASGRAIYKPGRGERPLWDYPDGLFRREAAAYELSRCLGLDLVPETVVRTDAPYGEGSLQRFVDADFSEHYFTLVERDECREPLRLLCAFDILLNSGDRKGGHVLFDQGEIFAIDNGLSFHVEDKLRTVMWDFAGEQLPERLTRSITARVDEALPRLAGLILPREIEALRERAQRMATLHVFPAPGSDHRAYPWPLV